MTTVLTADILICGGSFGAPAAALSAARTHPSLRVILAEPMEWLGGQATSQGVSAIDNAWHDPAKAQMRDFPNEHYAADYLRWLELMKEPDIPGTGLSPNGTCWVSRESYDPRSGAWALRRLCDEHSNLKVILRTVVKSVDTSPDLGNPSRRRINAVVLIQRRAKANPPTQRFLSQELPDWFSEQPSDWFDKEVLRVESADVARGLVVIDASETSDAIVLSGADYTIGRELSTEHQQSDGTPPNHDETASQATVFCFCMTGSESPDKLTDLRAVIPQASFDRYVGLQEREFYSLGSHGFHRVWTYRRLLARAPLHDWDQVHPEDVTMQNWNPGNDYPYGSIFKTRAEASEEVGGSTGWSGGLHLDHVAAAEQHALGFFLHMARLCREKGGFEAEMPRGNHALNMMGTWHGLAMFPYIRCGRRLVGLDGYRLVQDTLADSQGDGRNKTSQWFFDSVGIGAYACDVHPVKGSDGLGCFVHLPSGFHIPYRSLASRNVTNLLSGCKSMAASYWVNSAYRLHPIEWAAGSAAGVAAAHMAEEGLSNEALLDPKRLTRFQEAVARNSPIHWPEYSDSPFPGRRGDVLINSLKAIKAGQVVPLEIWAPGIRQALVESDGPGLHVAMSLTLVRGHAKGEFAVPASFGETARSLTVRVHVRKDCEDPWELLDVVTVPVSGTPVKLEVGDAVTIHPGESGFALTGDSWQLMAGESAWSTDGSMPGRVASYSFPVLSRGTYCLEMEWPYHPGAATDTPVTIVQGRSERIIRLDQSSASGGWHQLQTLTFDADGPTRVMVPNDVSDPTKRLVAGPIRLRRLS